MKVIYHINEIDKYSSLYSNTKNTLAYDATIDVVVVANGPAVSLFTNQELSLVVGVSYHICNNALRANDIEPSELIAGVTVVPSGVIDIIQLQDQAYRYIKV